MWFKERKELNNNEDKIYSLYFLLNNIKKIFRIVSKYFKSIKLLTIKNIN